MLAVVALAAALTATDPTTDMTFTLSGRSLTVKIGPDTPAKVKARLNGKKVGFVCVRSANRKMVNTYKTQLWPKGALTMRVTLPKALAHPTACGVERPDGEDISYGSFG